MRAECPDAEQLVAYLTTGLSTSEEITLEHHLLECDACTEAVTIMHQRWRMAERIAVPVPVPLTTQPAAPRAAVRASAGSGRRKRLAALTRLPILMPTAFAAGALIMLAMQQVWPQPSQSLTRAVSIQEVLRVRNRTPVYAAPDTHATLITTLPAKRVIDVREQYRSWYRIALPDGHDGWVEQSALE